MIQFNRPEIESVLPHGLSFVLVDHVEIDLSGNIHGAYQIKEAGLLAQNGQLSLYGMIEHLAQCSILGIAGILQGNKTIPNEFFLAGITDLYYRKEAQAELSIRSVLKIEAVFGLMYRVYGEIRSGSEEVLICNLNLAAG
jgi:predicted hotdog family 3-hydroxylacyl-ACP dehydratase